MTTTQRAAARVIDAWDSTVLPVANDGRLQEAMEDLRAVSEAAMATPTLREAAQQALEALTPLANATTPAEREALTDADAQAADAASCDLRAALAEQAAEQASPAYLAEPGAAQATRADLVANWPEHNRARMTVALHYATPAAEQAPHPSYPHITQPYTLEEIRAQIASHDYSAELLLQHAMLLLEAAEQAEPVAVPAGYALVPVEPTEAMLDAAATACDDRFYPADMRLGPRAMDADKYRAMIAASPPAPARQPAPALTVGMLMEAGLMVGSTPDSVGTSNWAVRMLGALRALAGDQPDAQPAPAADAMPAGWREVIADVAADISDHPSLAHEKLRRLLAAAPITAAPAEGGAA